MQQAASSKQQAASSKQHNFLKLEINELSQVLYYTVKKSVRSKN
jgi:hypothetical protein